MLAAVSLVFLPFLVVFSNWNWSFTLVIRVMKVCIKGQHRLLRQRFDFD